MTDVEDFFSVEAPTLQVLVGSPGKPLALTVLELLTTLDSDDFPAILKEIPDFSAPCDVDATDDDDGGGGAGE